MKIAMISRNEVAVPPKKYGGTERVIEALIKELVRRGHEVVLYAKQGSTSVATDTIFYPEEFKDEDILEYVLETLPEDVDIIHDHSEQIIFDKECNPETKIKQPVLFTVHYPSKEYTYKNAIYPSKFIRDKLDGLKERTDNVIYHGLDFSSEEYTFSKDTENYLLYLGQMKRSKNIDKAIDVSNQCITDLVLAGPKDPEDEEYFEKVIRPTLDNLYFNNIDYIGQVSGKEKAYLLSHAKAMIFPTEIESFGLAAIEAMACGTPCFFLDTCTGRELTDGLILPFDLVCKDTTSIARKISTMNLRNADRVIMSNNIKSKFSSKNMCDGYLREYEKLLSKNKISLCMIVKDEENTIRNCLDSVHDIVDEIIIVDTGSTDKTKEICSEYTDKIYDFEWIYDFSAARNYSISFATSEYIMFLDADDVLKEPSRQELKKIKEKMDGSIDLYWFYYDYRHNEQGESIYSFQTERIFKNNKGVKWNCIVHEVLDVSNLVTEEKTSVRITHTSNHDNTDKYVDFFKINMEKGHVFNSREKYFYAMELYKHSSFDLCYQLLEEIMVDPTGINGYEKSSVYNMAGYINRARCRYTLAIEQLSMSSIIHQPLPSINYEIAECYRALGLFDHAIYYYNTILSNILFREKFANESVYSNFEEEMKKFSIKSCLSLVMIYYNDLNDILKSIEINDKLLELDPNNECGLYNKAFFDKLKEGVLE